MLLLATIILMRTVAGSDVLACITSDQLIDSWSVRRGDCVHGEPNDGHLHFQSSLLHHNQTTVSWTSMRTGLHVPAGGNITMDLKCSSFSFVPGNPEFLFADRTRATGLISFEATTLQFKAGRDIIMEAITAPVVRHNHPIPSSCLTTHSAVSVRDRQGHLLEMHTNIFNETEWNGLYSDGDSLADTELDIETSLREQAIRLELVYQDTLERHYKLETQYLLLVNGDQTADLYDGFTQVATVQVFGVSQLRVTDNPYLATRNIPGGSCAIEIHFTTSGKRELIPCNEGPSTQRNDTAGAIEGQGRDLQSYCPTTQACGVNGRVICWEYR